MMEIELTGFSDTWHQEYVAEQDALIRLLGTAVKAMEHVGSTAVPVDLAKPVVDVLVGADPFYDVNYYTLLFDAACYSYLPTGMKNRHLFRKFDNGRWTHNIHIVQFNTAFYEMNEILFRDFIKDKRELMNEYALLKKSLQRVTSDMEEYTKGKTAFIQRVVDQARVEKGLPLVDVWE